jgi:hypothetical protein
MPESIIWSSSDERTPRGAGSEERDSRASDWWNQAILMMKLTDSASSARLENLRTSSSEIVDRLPDPENWTSSASLFTGLVVGAVQSGKTESMIGVASTAIDRGFPVVIVLTGNNEDLRRQTALRFNTQLLGQSDPKFGQSGVRTIEGSSGPGPLGGYAPPYFRDTNDNDSLAVSFARYLRRGEPIVITVKKDVANLESLGAAIRSSNLSSFEKPISLLIIDDECDEGSVGASGPENPIPRAISDLWQSSLDELQVAYVGYTATAAANLLQDTANPLYPTDLIYLLKYPSETSDVLSWEQQNFEGWYTGGEIFYRRFGYETGVNGNFVVQSVVTDTESSSPLDNHSLYEALIAYFVSGTFRFLLNPDWDFEDAQHLPDPHCMLVQASQSTRDHLRWRDSIKDLLGGTVEDDKTTSFDSDSILVLIAEDEDRWKNWFDNFVVSRDRITTDFGSANMNSSSVTWDDIKREIPTVVSNTRLKVVNSDDSVGTNLDFDEGWSDSGVVPPQDCFVIIVGGQKLSRGITIDGLCISYFTRASMNKRPYADATLQLSRWFGYRGSHIEFCRLFVTPQTHTTLLDIHENDQDYRKRLASLGSASESLEEFRIALRESPSYHLTAKTGPSTERYKLNFSPYTHLFNRVEIRDLQADNERWSTETVTAITNRQSETIIDSEGKPLGLLSKNWSAIEVADLIDGLRLSGHNPSKEDYPNPELYRDTESNRTTGRLLEVHSDPYVVAAYLRFWHHATRFPTPKFNIAVPFGTELIDAEPYNHALINEAISPDGVLLTDSWRSDFYSQKLTTYIDDPGERHIDDAGHRTTGVNGLLALYIVHKQAQGLGGGELREFHTPSIGLAIPAGGPSFQVLTNYQFGS